MKAWMAAGAAAAAFPDIDFLLVFIDPLFYLHHHRGVTHSVLLLPLWALLLGAAFAWLSGARAHWRAYTAVAALGIGVHVLGDLITPYGTLILMPLSRQTFGFGTTFIIDPWLSAMLVGALIGVRVGPPRGSATVGLVLIGAYVLTQSWFKDQAQELARAHAAGFGLPAAAASVYPQPLSPLNWKLVVTHPCTGACGYETALVNLWRRQDGTEDAAKPDRHAGFLRRLRAAYRPPDDLHWTFQPRDFQYPEPDPDPDSHEIADDAYRDRHDIAHDANPDSHDIADRPADADQESPVHADPDSPVDADRDRPVDADRDSRGDAGRGEADRYSRGDADRGSPVDRARSLGRDLNGPARAELQRAAAVAWRRPELAIYRAFARYPVVHRRASTEAGDCIWFRDLRFDLPGRPPPFRYGMCQHPDDGSWTRSQLGIW